MTRFEQKRKKESFRKKEGFRKNAENIGDNIDDIMAENGKVATLLPAHLERVLNTLLVFEGYYY